MKNKSNARNSMCKDKKNFDKYSRELNFITFFVLSSQHLNLQSHENRPYTHQSVFGNIKC
jgi:hypothetical protein